MTENEKTATPSKLDTAKTVTRFIAARATSGLVVTLAHQNINTDGFSKLQLAGVYVGAYLVGSIVADKAADAAEEKLVAIVDVVSDLKAQLNPATV